MSISESLSGVSTELDKILTQLQNIKGVQDEISAGAANIGPFGSRPGGGKTSKPVSQSGGSFTTPPKAPGSQLSGITPMATGGGGVVPPTVPGQTPMPPTPPGGSRLRNAALLGTAAVATAGYNLTPGIQDVIPFQSIKFGASVLSAGGYNQNYYGQVRALFGGHQTSPFGAMAAANIATMSGQGMGTGNFSTVMRETASTSLIFGMKDMDTASALSNMTSGTMAGRLAQYGIYVSDFQTGDSKGFGNLIDQIWRVHYGSSNRKISLESVAGSIRGGYLGAFVNQVFADDPILREMVIKALLMKAQAQGARLDYKSLGRYGSDGATPMPGAPGTKSAMDFSVSMGNTPENNPAIVQARAEGSRADVIDATADATMSGWRTTTYMAAAINELSEAIASNGGPIVDFFLALKGGIQGAQANGETNTILQILGGLLGGGGIRSILPFSTGGDVIGKAGTSTSDSIPARLSKGEYVINARAAQMLGTDYLDSLNSMGHGFGSGFASPAKSFAKGGSTTIGGFPLLEPGSPDLQSFSVGGKSVTLSKNYGHLLQKLLEEYAADPVLGPIVTLGGYDYRRAYNPDTGEYSGNWSKHAGGVAVDVNAGDWGMPPGRDIKPSEMSAVEKLLAANPSITWGGYWGGNNRDAMHFEVTSPSSSDPGTAYNPSTTSGSSESTTPQQTNIADGVRSLISLARGRPSVSGFSGFSGGAKGLGIGSGAFSWINSPLFVSSASGGISSGNGGISSESGGKSTTSTTEGASSHPAPTPGAGDQYLYDFLVSKGLRGSDLKTLWVIGRRESGGDPNLVAAMDRGKFYYPDTPDDFNSKSEYWRGGRYDVGLFQINSQHITKIKGGDMLSMIDPNNNFEMMKQLSSNFTTWAPWGIAGVTSSGFKYIDWSTWDRPGSNMWETDWGPKTEVRDKEFLGLYDAVNVHGYSEGAYNTHEGLAKLHEGEMVLPASTAEQFRKAMREGSMFQPKSAPNINITLHIDKASDEEAERFARKVRSYMQEHDWFDTVRRR